MAKYFSNIVLEPENIASLRDALIKKVVDDEDIRKVLTVKKVKNGEPLAILGEMDAVGNAGAGCSPTFTQAGIGNVQKRWDLGAWQIALAICYNDLEDTIAEYCLKSGTEIGDVQGTDFMAVFLDLLATQMKRMVWRLAWFGDTTADTIANGGTLTDGTDKTLFTPNDGLFKRLAAIVAADESKLTAISANEGATYAAQKAAMLADGYATGLVDTILLDADPMITANGDAVLIVNKKFADALAHDIKVTYKTNLPFERIFDGFYLGEYNGVTIIASAIWDNLINTYANTGTAWEQPYRAVLARPTNLLLGCDAAEPVSDLDVWFNKDERQVKIYAAGKLDTLVGQDDLVHVAW